MTPRERELLQGMGNCYSVCHADFEDTVGMVSSSRSLDPEETKSMLRRMAEKYKGDPEYRTLRGRLPQEFPF